MTDTKAITGSNAPQSTPGASLKLWKAILPVAIGITVVVLMFWHESKKENLADVWENINFSFSTIACILLGFCFMMGRDFGLSWRFRALADRKLTWIQAFRVDWLCEFTSCVTPSAVGGSSLGMIFLHSEGIELGRATTLMMTTLFLDELFFVVFCPIIVLITPLIYPGADLFSSVSEGFTHGLQMTFWVVYGAIAIWTLVLFLGIIVKPQGIRKLLIKIFSIKWLRKWQNKVAALGDNMVATSVELKKKPMRFWLEVFGATALSWISRYLVVNALFLGFLPQDNPQQWMILARQFVMWVVLMVSPTPGGAGLSEWIFTEFYGTLVPTAAIALILAVFWRIISYYVYLLIGAYVVPRWLRRTFSKSSEKK